MASLSHLWRWMRGDTATPSLEFRPVAPPAEALFDADVAGELEPADADSVEGEFAAVFAERAAAPVDASLDLSDLAGALSGLDAAAATAPLEKTASERECLIVQSLLRQIPEVGYLTLDKLSRAGLMSRETLYATSAGALAAAAETPVALCEQICRVLQDHRMGSQGALQAPVQAEQIARLAALVDEVRHHHDAFQRAADDATLDRARAAEKRLARQQRQACFRKVDSHLVEMREVGLLQRIRTLAVGDRIARLEEYVLSHVGHEQAS